MRAPSSPASGLPGNPGKSIAGGRTGGGRSASSTSDADGVVAMPGTPVPNLRANPMGTDGRAKLAAGMSAATAGRKPPPLKGGTGTGGLPSVSLAGVKLRDCDSSPASVTGVLGRKGDAGAGKSGSTDASARNAVTGDASARNGRGSPDGSAIGRTTGGDPSVNGLFQSSSSSECSVDGGTPLASGTGGGW